MTEIKFTPTSPEAQQYERICKLMGEVERISTEPSEEELQAIIDGLRAELTEPAPDDSVTDRRPAWRRS